MKYLSNQKLWRVVKEPTGYYFEIKLAGVIIDRVRIEEPVVKILKQEGVI